jgi:integrase
MLSDAKARKLKPTDKPVSDGSVRGLYLFPSSMDGSGKWIMRFVSPETGVRRDMGLGTYPAISIKEARSTALAARALLEQGTDPLEEKKRDRAAETKKLAVPAFETAAKRLHADIAPGFRNKKHGDQWINTLEKYVFPEIGRIAVNLLTPADFAKCLKPIWLEKPETASRVKQRCDAVMDWCAASGFVIASPVTVVDKLLPKQPGKRERVSHFPALPWRDIPLFAKDVLRSGTKATSKPMLEFLILTATRSGEVRQMTWQEIDFKEKIWTIPAARMKAKVTHRVPLTPRAIEILNEQAESLGKKHGLVFPSRNNTPFSDATLTKFLSDKEIASDTPDRFATAHGFRSSFRDWASENGYARDLAEKALAHTIKNATEAAYHRTDLLDQRRVMMEAWEKHVMAPAGD